MQNINGILAGAYLILFIYVALTVALLANTLGCPEDQTTDAWDHVMKPYAGLSAVIGVVKVGLGVMIVVLNGHAVSNYSSANQEMERLTIVNGCSDSLTKVDLGAFT